VEPLLALLEPSVFLPVALILLLSGVIYGVFGFAYVLISIAFLPYFIDVKIAIPMIAVQIPVYSSVMLFGLRKHVSLAALPLIVGLFIGLPFGVYLLGTLDDAIIRKLLGSVILLHCLLSVRTISSATPMLSGRGWPWLFGVLSGVIGGAVVAAGPITVAYLTLRRLSKEEFKATFLAWALAMGCVLPPLYGVSGILNSQALVWGIVTLPFAGIGVFLGSKLFRVVAEPIFFRLLLILLTLSALRLIIA